MQYISLLTLLLLAMLAACTNGRVTINGRCVDCNQPNGGRTATRVPQSRQGYSGRSYGQANTVKPRQMSRRPASAEDWNMDGFNLYQHSNGGQYISTGGRGGYSW